LRPPNNWKLGGSRTAGSDFSTGIVAVAAAAAAATAGTPGVEAVSTAMAAVLPATGAGTTLNPGVTTTAITTASVTTATTAVTAAAAIATAAGPAATATADGPGFSFVDAQRTSHQLGSLEGFNGAVLALGIGHFNKREAPLASSFPLEGKGTAHDLAERGEKFRDVLLLSAEGKIAYENAHGRTRGDQRGKSKWL